jgi:hypothetical protein
MKRNKIIQSLLKEGFSEKTLVNFNDRQLANVASRILGEEEVGGYKEGPGEKLTPELDHFNKIVKPQLSNAGFKYIYEKILMDYGKENSMVYGDHNKGVNVVWDRKKGVYSVYVGNNKGLKTFSLGPADPKLVANNVVKYALSLKNGLTNLSEADIMISKKDPLVNQKIKDAKDKNQSIETYEEEMKEELKGNQKKLDKNHNGKIDGQDFKILKGQKKEVSEDKKCKDCGCTKSECKCKKCDKCDCTKSECKCKKSNIKEWVSEVTNKKFHSFTSKNEIMEMIQFKLQEAGPNVKVGHNGTPEFMTYEAAPEPSKPGTDAPVREKPTTKPGKPKRENPFEPKHNPKPKAEGDEGLPEFLKFDKLGIKFKNSK